ncbi:MAG TPA: hypothetical protein PKH93_06440, partial [Chitinophagales bacterium]|nr:hypothetical protein [Chitinophagales bacterium]
QGHGKIGIRVAGGISNLYDEMYKFTPIPAYSLGLTFLEKDKPFCISGEIAFDRKGGYSQISKNTHINYLSIYLLPQFKLKPLYKHSFIAGVYCSVVLKQSIENDFTYIPIGTSRITGYFSVFDTGLTTAYKYQLKTTAKYNFQIDARFNYGFYNINPSTFGRSGWTHNIVAQLGLNFVLNK